MKRRTVLYLLIGAIATLQLFQIDRTNPPTVEKLALASVEHVPDDVMVILKKACFDCHSNQTVYPWYAGIQPVGWWLKHHVDEARVSINFSDIGQLDEKQRSESFEHCAHEVEDGEMPLKSYTWLHAGARLSPEEKKRLIEWFRSPTRLSVK
jgi:Haem-binding domain